MNDRQPTSDFPFEAWDIVQSKSDSGTAARIRYIGKGFVSYHIIFSGLGTTAASGEVFNVTQAEFVEQWEFVSKSGITVLESSNELNRLLSQFTNPPMAYLEDVLRHPRQHIGFFLVVTGLLAVLVTAIAHALRWI